MVLLTIIPTKWLFHWGYTSFSDIPIFLQLIQLEVSVKSWGYPKKHPSFFLTMLIRSETNMVTWRSPMTQEPPNSHCRYVQLMHFVRYHDLRPVTPSCQLVPPRTEVPGWKHGPRSPRKATYRPMHRSKLN